LTKTQNFVPDWPELGHIRAKFGSKQGEKVVLKSREWYYIISMHKYYRLTYFLVLMGCLTKNQPWLAWTKPYKSQMRKYSFQERDSIT